MLLPTAPQLLTCQFIDSKCHAVNLPVGLVSWAEGLLCELGYRAIGGHVWYDASIPLSMLVYYAVVLGTIADNTSPAGGKAMKAD